MIMNTALQNPHSRQWGLDMIMIKTTHDNRNDGEDVYI